MKTLDFSTQFKKDRKKWSRSGIDLSELDHVIQLLQSGLPIPSKHRDHQLDGELKGKRDLHVKGDQILIYARFPEKVVLHRFGTHSELFH